MGALVRVGESRQAGVAREGPSALLQPLAPRQTGGNVLKHGIGVLGACEALVCRCAGRTAGACHFAGTLATRKRDDPHAR